MLIVAQHRLIESVEIKSTQETLLSDYLLIDRARLQEENDRLRQFIVEWRDVVYQCLTSVHANIKARGDQGVQPDSSLVPQEVEESPETK